MTDRFSIDYKITRVDCSSTLKSDPNYLGVLLNIADGEAVLRYGDQSVSTGRCALLSLSSSLVRLCTFPVLYGMEAHETVMETGMGLQTTYDAGKIALAVYVKRERRFVFEVPLDELLQTVGAFHHRLLIELFERCPSLHANNHLLVRIPDAFAIKHIGLVKGLSHRPDA